MVTPDPRDPRSPRSRNPTRESQHQVRRLLLVWDPIGVADTDSVDEYDFMISSLMHLLYEGADELTLLKAIEDSREKMGLTRDDGTGSNARLAADLADWWERRTRSS